MGTRAGLGIFVAGGMKKVPCRVLSASSYVSELANVGNQVGCI